MVLKQAKPLLRKLEEEQQCLRLNADNRTSLFAYIFYKIFRQYKM